MISRYCPPHTEDLSRSLLLENLPNRYPRAYRDIERMFGAKLRNLYAEIAQIHQSIVNAFDLVAKD